MKLELVPVDLGNLQMALDIAIEIFGEGDREDIEQEFKGSLGLLPEREILTKEYKIGDLALFIMYKDGVPAGVTGYYTIQDHEEDMWLEWTGVLPQHRGNGTGISLVQKAFEIAANRYEFRNLRIWTTLQSEYDGARAVYKKMGFIEEPYRPGAEDAAKLVVVFSKSATPGQSAVTPWRGNAYPIDCEQHLIPNLNEELGLGKKQRLALPPPSPRKTGTGPSRDA